MAGRYEIRYAGSGGQGVILAAVITGRAAAIYEDGLYVVQSQAYGPEARGGKSKAEVILSTEPIDYPKAMKPNLQVILTQQAAEEYVVDTLPGGYELLALTLDGSKPRFADTARAMRIPEEDLTIYHSPQCPYIADCLQQVCAVCEREGIPLRLIPVESAAQAKALPGVFNNWAVFYKGRFQTLHLLNEGYLMKMLASA